MEFKGLEGMLKFLEILNEKGIKIRRIDQFSEDRLTISFALVGVRIEVDFYADHMEFNYFKGSEDIKTDYNELMKLFDEHWDS